MPIPLLSIPGRRSCPHGRGRRGFSLFEALITLVLVTTLMMVGIPAFGGMLIRHEQMTAINTLLSALHLARIEAIKRQTRVALCPSRDGHSCLGRTGAKTAWHDGYIVYADLHGTRRRDATEPVIRHVQGHDRIRVLSGHGGSHIVVFQANGFATLTNDTFQFCDPGGRIATRVIVLSNSGRPRISSSTEGCPATDG